MFKFLCAFIFVCFGQTDQEFLDSFLSVQQKQYNFPSGAISFRSSAAAAPLTAVVGQNVNSTSLFRLASVTKSFTAISVLRLVDDGLLSLDDRIDMHLPPNLASLGWPPEIKVIDLMTHTAGFDEVVAGMVCDDYRQCTELATFLAANKPRLNRPTRSAPGYSNYGVALAGAIVAHKRSVSWGAYLEQTLFPAVGMTAGSYALPQNVPWTRMVPNLAPPGVSPHYWSNMEPAGLISSCAADMHAYMQMLANVATPGVAPVTGQRILSASSVQKMRDSGVWPQVGLGLFQESFGAEALAYSHGGDLDGFSIKIHFVPRTGLYMFIAIGMGASETRKLASCMLAARFAPGVVPPLPSTGAAAAIFLRNEPYYSTRNVFTGPLTLSYIVGRLGTGDVVHPAVPAPGNLTLNFRGIPFPFSVVSSGSQPSRFYEYSGPRNNTDLDFCNFIATPYVQVNEDYFTLFSPFGGWMRSPNTLTLGYSLGILFAALAGVGLSGIALYLALLIRHLKERRDSHKKTSTLGTILSIAMFAMVPLSFLFILLFFLLYLQTIKTIGNVSTATSSTWAFVLACPKILLAILIVAGLCLVALIIVRPKSWVHAMERYVISALFVVFLVLLIVGFANVNVLF